MSSPTDGGGSVAGSTGTGALSGAAAGSMFGPWGAAAGAIIGAVGGFIGGEAAKKAGDYKAAVAQRNAQYALQNAAMTRAEYSMEAGIVGQKGAQELGQQKVAQSGTGLDVNTGTAANVRKSQLAQIQTNEAITAYQGAKKAYGYDIAAANFGNEAALDTMTGQAGEVSSFLGGASTVADKWTKFQQA
jgi:hypothetical protein